MNIYAILISIYLIFLILVALVASRKLKDTTEDYYVAGRSMNKWIVAGTYGASFISAGSFIGMIGSSYAFGWLRIWDISAPMLTMFVLAAFFAKKFWRIGYLHNAQSMPDLLSLRYPSKMIRGIYSMIIFIVYTVGMAAMYLGIYSILSIVTDFSFMTYVIIAAVTILIYSLLGGARGIAWTDTISLIFMIFSVVATVTIILISSGGLSNLITEFSQTSTPGGKDWEGGGALTSLTNSSYPIMMIISFYLVWFLGNLTQPHQMTRVYLAKDEKAAVSGVALIIIPMSLFAVGIPIIGAYARTHFPNLETIDHAFPMAAMDTLPTILAAVALIGMVSAILSTASTMLIISAQSISYDFYKKLINPNTPDKQIVNISRLTMIIGTLISIVIAYLAQHSAGLLILWSSAFAMMGAGILPSLVATFYWKRANVMGCLTSMIIGFGSTLSMYLIPSLVPNWAAHPILPGFLLSVSSLIIVSLLTKKPDKDVIEKFFGEKLKDPNKRKENVA